MPIQEVNFADPSGASGPKAPGAAGGLSARARRPDHRRQAVSGTLSAYKLMSVPIRVRAIFIVMNRLYLTVVHGRYNVV